MSDCYRTRPQQWTHKHDLGTPPSQTRAPKTTSVPAEGGGTNTPALGGGFALTRAREPATQPPAPEVWM